MRLGHILICLGGMAMMAMNSISARAADAEKIFRVRDYGAVANAQTDATPAIQAAIQAAIAAGPGAEVVFEAGRYRIESPEEHAFPLTIHQARGLILRGAGASVESQGATELVVTKPANACLLVSDCEKVMIRDFVVDYDPLPFTQGRITAVDYNAKTFDLELEEGYSSLNEPYFAAVTDLYSRWGMIFEPNERRLKPGVPDCIFIGGWEPLEGPPEQTRRWRMRPPAEHAHNVGAMAPGDRFVHMARQGGGTLGFTNSDDCSLVNVTVHASPGLCVLVNGCRDTRIDGYQVCFRPGTTRLLSSDSDGIHAPDNPGPLTIENCLFEGMADDAINIYNKPAIVRQVISPTEVIASEARRMKTGDRVAIFDSRAGRMRGEATVVEMAPEGARHAGERHARGGRGRRGGWGGDLRIRLDAPIEGMVAAAGAQGPIEEGIEPPHADLLYDLSRCGGGFAIRNNLFRNHRRYAMYINSRDGVIENNRVERIGGWGIVLHNETSWWMQGPPGRDLVIRNNMFRGVGFSGYYGETQLGGAIKITGTAGHDLAQGRIIHGIRVENNTIEDPPVVGISIGAASDIVLKNNTIRIGPETPMKRHDAAVVIKNAEGVKINNLVIKSVRPETTAGIAIDEQTAPGEEGVKIKDLQFKGPAGAPEIQDDRR